MLESKKNKIFLFGLDNAGKTTILKLLKEDEIIENSDPTRQFDIVNMIIKDLNCYIWDAPGQIEYRKRWEKGVIDTDILIFLLDTADNERFSEAKKELERVLNELDTEGLPLIACFHKLDLKDAQDNLKEAIETLNLREIKERKVNWLKTSVYTKEGIEDLKLLVYLTILMIEKQKGLDSIQVDIDSIQKKYNIN